MTLADATGLPRDLLLQFLHLMLPGAHCRVQTPTPNRQIRSTIRQLLPALSILLSATHAVNTCSTETATHPCLPVTIQGLACSLHRCRVRGVWGPDGGGRLRPQGRQRGVLGGRRHQGRGPHADAGSREEGGALICVLLPSRAVAPNVITKGLAGRLARLPPAASFYNNGFLACCLFMRPPVALSLGGSGPATFAQASAPCS